MPLSPAGRVTATLILLGAASAACDRTQPKPFAPPPAQVGVIRVVPASIPEPYEFVGQVEAFRRVEVRSRVDGIVLDRPFIEGSVVRKGQILYKLDQVKYDAVYRSALARLDNAKRTLARLEPLVAKHAVAQQDVDNAHSDLESAQAALDNAKKDLDDTVIRAEIAGQVGRARLELGARVTGPADLLTTIDELDPVYVTFHPSSQQLLAWQQDPQAKGLLRSGSTGIAVRVVLPDGSLLPRVGRINFVSPSLDSASGTQEFRAKFDNGDHRLVPGQFVHVRLEGFARARALAVPQRAVQQGLGRQFVYVVGVGDTVTAHDVKTGSWSGTLWLIDSGLVAGDRVVVDGVQKVAPGRVVKPVPIADSAARIALPTKPSNGDAR
jgi:membrane fusion protein (multidrug efflux system)